MLTGWVEKHKAKTPGNRALQQQLDEWMQEWEASEKHRHDTAAAAATDEGWTVVTKQRVSFVSKFCMDFPAALARLDMLRQHLFSVQGRKKSTDQSGTSVGSVAAAVAAAAQSRKAPKQLLDFYRFQARDRRRNSTWLLGACNASTVCLPFSQWGPAVLHLWARCWFPCRCHGVAAAIRARQKENSRLEGVPPLQALLAVDRLSLQ